MMSYNLTNLGRVYVKLKEFDKALDYFFRSLELKLKVGDKWAASETYLRIGQIYNTKGEYAQSIDWCKKGLPVSNEINEIRWLSELYKCLYKSSVGLKNYKEAVAYNELFTVYNDSLLHDKAEKKLQEMEFDKIEAATKAEQDKKEALAQAEIKQQKLVKYLSIGGLVVVLIFTFGIYKRFIDKRKANDVLEKTLSDLRTTQQQLVQQEKLASLGALTAGIAHEIKNPLNFVNNFSELSNDLIDEFLETKDNDERKEIANDLKLNLKKINEHGKRADSIVKNMLQHSRSGSGEKQLTDINQMCEEYLNLAYHGKRAGVPDFNCEMIKHLDKNLPKINCVPQDISRVILNLINNALDELANLTPNPLSHGEGAKQPTLTLSTVFQLSATGSPDKNRDEGRVRSDSNGVVLIKVKDNGRGIPAHIKEKIFEPFFTTKPAGQGTGLGLSLSFDIIKAHGGKIEVESKENEFTEFVISIPV